MIDFPPLLASITRKTVPIHEIQGFALKKAAEGVCMLRCQEMPLNFIGAVMTWSPIWKAGSGSWSLFAWWACEIFVASIQSHAAHTLLSMDSIRFLTFSNSVGCSASLFSVVEGWLLPSKGGSNCGDQWPCLRTLMHHLSQGGTLWCKSAQTQTVRTHLTLGSSEVPQINTTKQERGLVLLT